MKGIISSAYLQKCIEESVFKSCGTGKVAFTNHQFILNGTEIEIHWCNSIDVDESEFKSTQWLQVRNFIRRNIEEQPIVIEFEMSNPNEIEVWLKQFVIQF